VSAELLLDRVSAGYGNVHVLQEVSVELGQSETLAILGPNGSGKSTMAKTVMNLATLYSGSISWRGHNISRMPGWRRVQRGLGYLPQGLNVFQSLTVEENLSLAVAGQPRKRRRDDLGRVKDLFPELDLLGATLAGRLSGGERRIVALAATLLLRPEMLILDEPTSDLAPVMIERMFEAIRQVRADTGMAILLVEQNVERALALADRVCILRRGAIVLDRAVGDVSEAEIISEFMEHPESSRSTESLAGLEHIGLA
jgi:ABC-type branched-subunit amino acid transport system ATPase component